MSFAIDVISDVVCPWCYVGKRRLEAALAELADHDPGFGALVNYHPFQLNPGLPYEGIDRRAHMEAKFGSGTRLAEIHARLNAVGESVGIAFEFDRITRQPNTLDAHRLISWAQARADAGDVVERLFRAFFVEGRDVGDRAVLAAIAGEAGLDATAAHAFLDSGEGVDRIAAMDARARQLGVEGVPFFVFNEKIAVSGAHEPSVLIDAIAQAREAA